ncbi:hypothetical protein ACIBCN_19425 [Nocardia sp. NPDC051052]|uniref:hypothetical protein n=1 Tax=Nocardia sp. NPDC051052 TaxID=3364322 RepID=UPI0037B8F103
MGSLSLVISLVTVGCIGAATADAKDTEECGTHAEEYFGTWKGRLQRSSSVDWKITLYPPQKVDGERDAPYNFDDTFTGEYTIRPDQRDKLEVKLTSKKSFPQTMRLEPICPAGSTRPDSLRHHYQYGGATQFKDDKGNTVHDWVDNYSDLKVQQS